MNTEEKIEKICERIINGRVLTTNVLKECGLSAYDIKLFVNSEILEKVKRAEYRLSNVDYLYNYSKKLSNSGFCEKATLGFLKCYEINPNHSYTCFQLFIRSLIVGDYEKVFEYFDKFYGTNDELLKSDNQFFLYMLSLITDVPDRYRSDLKEIQFKLIKTDDERIEDTHILNTIRYYSMNSKYTKALQLLNIKEKKQGYLSMTDLTTKILLERIKKLSKEKEKIVLSMLKKEDYDGIISLFENDTKKDLQGFHNKLLYLSRVAKQIKETSELPNVNSTMTSSFDEAIQNNNFPLALKICHEYDKKFNLSDNKNWIYLLLEKIVALVNKLENNLQDKTLEPKKVKSVYKMEEAKIEGKKIDETLEKKLELLRTKQGISITKSMKKEKRDKILDEIKELDDISAIEIGALEPKRIVFIYTPRKKDSVEIGPIVKEANKLYGESSYKKALQKYIEILETGKPVTITFARIGLCYMKINSVKKAIEYFTVATELSQKLGEDFDFTELIMKLKGLPVDENSEVKFRAKVNLSDFDNDIDSFYGIDDIEKITELVRNGLTVEEIGDRFYLTLEQIDIVKLIFARECYIVGNFVMGDSYLKMVERSKNKTDFVISLMTNIVKNKKFFMHRDLSKHKTLCLELIKKD